MALSQILGTVGGFIFNPAAAIAKQADKPRFTRYAVPVLCIAFIPVLQRVTASYIIHYPEPLYYGLGLDTPQAYLHVNEQCDPWLLAFLVTVLFSINGVLFFSISGNINFSLLKILLHESKWR